MDSKEEFLKIFDENITRPGADGLRKYLLGSDFFTAPASGRFHCCHEGGLCEHSINVYKRLLAIAKAEYGDEWESRLPHESIAICGLLHDVCKIGYYKEDLRNVKNENGEWIKVPYYTRAEELPYGHGEKVGIYRQRLYPPYARRSARDKLAHGRV